MSSTQIRLQQLTGSLASIKDGVTGVSSQGAAAAFNADDLEGILQYYAQALTNLHGAAEFGNQTIGKIAHATNDIVLESQGSGQQIYLDASNKVRLAAAGTDADSMKIESEQGGVDIDALLSVNIEADEAAADAIRLNATAGGIDIDSADVFSIVSAASTGGTPSIIDGGAQLDLEADYAGGGQVRLRGLGSGGQVNITANSTQTAYFTDSLSTFQNVPVAVTDSSAAAESDQGALRVTGGAGIGGDLHVGSSLVVTGSVVEFVNSAAELQFAEDAARIGMHSGVMIVESDAALFLTGAGGASLVSDHATYGVELKATQAGLYLTGSDEIVFATDSTDHGGWQGGVALSKDVDGATFFSNFGTKSILGAINALNVSLAGTQPTLMENKLSADVSESAGSWPVVVAFVEGDNTSLAGWSGLKKNELDVYVNGQLLRSGSSDDYVLNTTTGQIDFKFPILAEDLVVAIERK